MLLGCHTSAAGGNPRSAVPFHRPGACRRRLLLLTLRLRLVLVVVVLGGHVLCSQRVVELLKWAVERGAGRRPDINLGQGFPLFHPSLLVRVGGVVVGARGRPLNTVSSNLS